MSEEQFELMMHAIRKISFINTVVLLFAICVCSCNIERSILRVKDDVKVIKDREK